MVFDKIKVNKIDFSMLSIFLLLLIIGAGFLLSASFYVSQRINDGNSFQDFYSHLFAMVIGISLGSIIFCLGPKFFSDKKIILFIIISIFILLTVTSIFGIEKNGAKRWIELFSYSLQTSDLVKFGMIIVLASNLSNQFLGKKELTFIKVLPSLCLVFVVLLFIILAQKNLSTGILIFATYIFMLFVAGYKKRYIALICAAFLLLGVLSILLVDYRLERFFSFFSEADKYDSGYQISQSLESIARGDFFGVGFGNSYYKYYSRLPESSADFIFAIIAEETGLFGMLIVLALFLVFGTLGLKIAKGVKDDMFNFLLACGLTFSIFFQALVHMSVVVKIFPTTGINLPFFSSGGTSIMVSTAMVFLILRVSTYKEENEYA